MHFLKSKKTAIVLISTFLGLLVVSVIVPQSSYYPSCEVVAFRQKHPMFMAAASRLSLDEIFTSVPFYVLVAALALSITVCTGSRALRLFFREYFETGPPDGAPPENARRFPARRQTSAAGPKIKMAGSVLFHLSLIVIMGGFSATSLFGFKAYVTQTEGQTITESHDSYAEIYEGNLFFENHKFFHLRLDSVKRTFDRGFLTDIVLRAVVEENGSEIEREIRINQPLTHRGVEFVVKDFGYTPRFRLVEKKTGREVLSSYVNIAAGPDFFDVPGEGLRIYTRLQGGAKPPSAKPGVFGVYGDVVRFKVERADARGGWKFLVKGKLRKDRPVDVDGYELRFDDVRSWVLFRVVRDPGRTVSFLGFWLCAAGLVIRFAPLLFDGGGRKPSPRL